LDLSLLPNRFKKNNRHGGCQVQAARSVHRDSDAIVDVRLQQRLRQSFRFTAEKNGRD